MAGELTVVQVGPRVCVRVHPVVILNICDCYVRRPDGAERVIGTLLGSVLSDGTVEITNSYAVPHNEYSAQVAVDIEYHHNMMLSHLKVNPKEVIVGWYSTGLSLSGGTALIHEFYSREVPTKNPILLTLDTLHTLSIRAFVSSSLSLSDRPHAAHFHQVPLDLDHAAHRIGLDILKRTSVEKIPSDLEAVESSIDRLLALVDDVYKYVHNVAEGNIAPDNAVGRFISDTLGSVPKLSLSAFNKLVNDSLQDHLLLLYLSSITRTQLSLAEKLNTAAQIL